MPFRRVTRSRLLLAAVAAAALALAACAEDDPPPTSPLDDVGTDTTATAPADATQRPLPTFTPSPGGTAGPADAQAEMERVSGEAISRLAEWTGVAETEFRLIEIEAVEWPSACLGVDIPDLACAEVVTPGYRVEIAHAGQPATPYVVHASQQGRYVWAPAAEGVIEIEALNFDDNRVVLDEIDEPGVAGTQFRIVPGSYLPEPFAEYAVGEEVSVGLAPPLPGEEFGLVVWMVRVSP